MSGFRFRLNLLSCIAYCHDMHHIMIMPDFSHLVIIVASVVCLVLRFFTDRTVELMRATTSSLVFIANVYQASIPSSATYFTALPPSILLALCLRCFSCLDPIIVYLAADILPTFHHLLPCLSVSLV